MATLRFARVDALPVLAERTASTVYFAKNVQPGLLDMYVVGNDVADVQHVVSFGDVSTMVTGAIAGLQNLKMVPDIAGRDAYIAGLDRNALILVGNATADNTVKQGAATYFYDKAANTITKVSEQESMDVVVNWNDIVGRPNVTVAEIEAAVAATHTHANKADLDQLGVNGDGNLTIGGNVAYAPMTTATW